jgi:molybdate transport system substrate-binding protein
MIWSMGIEGKIIFLITVFLLSLSSGYVEAGEEITVSAASSLTDVFTELGQGFERTNPGVTVIFNFASSGSLLRQIERGAPVDLFASADSFTMDEAVVKKVVIPASRFDFARNSLVLIVPNLSGQGPTSLKDLADPAVSRIALGAPQTVPAGRYARKLLEEKGLWKLLLPKYIYADSVRQVLDYVRRDEVETGIVYRTDALTSGDMVRVIDRIGPSDLVRYPIAIVAGSQETLLAKRWINYLSSAEGRDVFARYGFEIPAKAVQSTGRE